MTVSSVPARESSIRLPDGRTLAIAEWGPPDGRPLLALYGTPGSRLFCPDAEATTAANIRLIAVDRPGYGRSDPRKSVTVPDVADDLAELGSELGIDACPVFGWSGGGPYALGLAAGHPARVSSVGIAASWGPLRRVPGVWETIPAERRALFDLAARDPEAARSDVEQLTQWYADDPERLVERDPEDPDPDVALHRVPAIAAALRTWFREGARQGSRGFVDDWIATYARDWDFDLASVSRPVTIWWGNGDTICGRDHVSFLERAIPGARLRVWSNVGHLGPVLHWAEILATLT